MDIDLEAMRKRATDGVEHEWGWYVDDVPVLLAELDRERRARGLEQLDMARLESQVDRAEAKVKQLREAGIRLAALLDETLGSAPGTVDVEDVDAALSRWDSLVHLETP